MSRADLTRETGLSSAGVTKITAQMRLEGIIREGSASEAAAIGRPPVTVEINSECRYVLAIHLGARQVHVALSDVSLSLSLTETLAYDLSEPTDALVARIAELARGLIARSAVPADRILGVGIGVPGSVDETRRVNTHSILTGWHDVHFADAFEAELGLPAVVEHNATALALAECCYGVGKEAESLLYLLLGKGIGAGYAQTGPMGRRSAVEIGHVVVEPGGRPCRCGGRGCLERFFSEEPLRALVGNPELSRSALLSAAMNHPEWDKVSEAFLLALGTTVTLLGPEMIVLGGDLSGAPEAFVSRLREELPGRVMPQQRNNLRIERARFTDPAGAYGAACIALESFFYATGPVAPRWPLRRAGRAGHRRGGTA
ncbi:ROK family protein [Yangia sp. PrR002]|nr:ROK family protein [Salipiger sp. PrR002]NDW57927.1 ROK family protein [Salipiger sp. PrR004]